PDPGSPGGEPAGGALWPLPLRAVAAPLGGRPPSVGPAVRRSVRPWSPGGAGRGAPRRVRGRLHRAGPHRGLAAGGRTGQRRGAAHPPSPAWPLSAPPSFIVAVGAPSLSRARGSIQQLM